VIGLEGAKEHEPPGHGGGPGKFDMEGLVGIVLLVGVLFSLLLIVVGIVWHWTVAGRIGLDYTIAGMNLFRFVIHDIRDALHGMFRPRLFVNLGIAVLMLTPFARVLASVLYFGFRARNWKYALFTGIVLSVLTYSLFLR
jgi:uncharacterized membrane protein